MAGENVELVRAILADWERGDFSSTQWAHPEIEWITVDGPAPGRWIGLAGMAEASRDWINTWEHYHVKAREYRELDLDRVLVLFDYGGRGKTSGIELGALGRTGAGVYHIRDGRVTRIVAWWEQERALSDLGLPRETGERNQAMSHEDIELVLRAFRAGGQMLKPDQFGGRARGAPAQQRFWFVVLVQGGQIKRTEAYTDARDALEALVAHVGD